ncbi:MAG: hypothetical protein P1V20_21220 [Verrucomicrobiales bacterium]|nr:hypothetical protein [Verrucomicrobiales bacterium]
MRGLNQINQYLKEQDIEGELCIFDGACMCLAYSARTSTKDVDAVFQPADKVRKAIFEVGIANGWDWNWINDDVAGFLSTKKSEFVAAADFEPLSHLKILFPRPEYLLAMKCLAARSGTDEEPSPDLSDALWLCRHLKIRDKNAITSIVMDYYPDEELSSNSSFFIEELETRIK